MTKCASCFSEVDDRKPIVVRVFVVDKNGRERALCPGCWAEPDPSKRKGRK